MTVLIMMAGHNKYLMLSMLGKNFSRQHFEILFLYVKAYFLEKNKNNIINLSSGEFDHRVVKIKASHKMKSCRK